MADYRLKTQKREQEKRERLEKQAPVLTKYLTVVFWTTIASIVPGALCNQLTMSLPGLYRTGLVLSLLSSLGIGGAYFLLRKINDRYGKAAICIGVTVLGDFVLTWITGGTNPAWTLLVSLPLAVLGFVGKFQLYNAHSEVLISVEYVLSEKWMKLWRWYIGLFAATVSGILLVVVVPVLGALTVLAAAIGTIVVSIVELVYLHRMMDCFRTYTLLSA